MLSSTRSGRTTLKVAIKAINIVQKLSNNVLPVNNPARWDLEPMHVAFFLAHRELNLPALAYAVFVVVWIFFLDLR